MFLVNDTISERHEQIRALDPCMGVILAAADSEWTLRRAILALGTEPTKLIEPILSKSSGLNGYKDAWKKVVLPYTGKQLSEVIPNWDVFQKEAYPLRDKLMHGIKGAVGAEYARERMECILAASRALNEFAEKHGEPLYGRKIIRMKPREPFAKSA